MVACRMPPTGDLAHNPGMCPDWDSNQWPFGSQAHTQSTKLHQPGGNSIFYIFLSFFYSIPGLAASLLNFSAALHPPLHLHFLQKHLAHIYQTRWYLFMWVSLGALQVALPVTVPHYHPVQETVGEIVGSLFLSELFSMCASFLLCLHQQPAI